MPGDRLDVGDRQVGAREDDRIGAAGTSGVGHDGQDSRLFSGRSEPSARASPSTATPDEAALLAFIDQIVIPFLNSLYGAVGYLGVTIAMAIESAMVPLPSELILPYAGFLVSDPSHLEPLTRGQWSFWPGVIAATIGNTLGSLIAYAIGAWGGRPFLERYGRYLLIRPHEIELAERFFDRYGSATAFFSRLLPIVRTFISFPAGVARMPLGKFMAYSTAGALPWSMVLVYAGERLGANWVDIRRALQPFDLAIAVAAVVLIALFIWWRLGMPGRSGRRRAA